MTYRFNASYHLDWCIEAKGAIQDKHEKKQSHNWKQMQTASESALESHIFQSLQNLTSKRTSFSDGDRFVLLTRSG